MNEFNKSEYAKKYYQKNKEKIINKSREYYQNNKDKRLKYILNNKEKRNKHKRDWYQRNKERVLEYGIKYRLNNKERGIEYDRKYNYNIKMQVFNYYSNYDIKCNCCGERHMEFLSIDHIENNGGKHRKDIGSHLYRWLLKNNFPKEFQILCMNCNFAKGKDKDHICIHKKEINDCIFDYQVVA